MKRFLFFFILGCAVLWGVVHHPRFLLLRETVQYRAVDAELLTNSYRNLGYVIEDNRWITFPLTPNIAIIKVVTNAGISKENSMISGGEYHYALEYEIRGGQNNDILHHGTYYHLSQLSRYSGSEESEPPHTASLYLDPNIVPVDGRVMTINQADWSSPQQQAEQIRIRLVERDMEVTDVLLRLYVIQQNAQSKELYNWQRLSVTRRQKQARGNVYPYDFLSDNEKINLINRRWRPIGPLGIPGKDYHIRNLYTRKDSSEEPAIDDTPPALPSIDPGQLMTFPIAAGGMRLRFSFTEMEQGEKNEKGTVRFNWFGPTAAQRSTRDISTDASGQTIVELSFEQGLVEIRSEQPLTVGIWQQTDDDWIEWYPEPLFSRSTLCSSGEDVAFTLVHLDTQQTPLRITLRAPETDGVLSEYKVEYNLHGSPGAGGILRFTPQPSLYDRMLVAGQEVLVSEPATFYLNVPPQVSGIRFSSSSPVLVAVSTRPSDLSHLVRVPEDYDRISATDARRQPVWFPLLPDAYREIFQRQRSILVHVQQRPPVDDQDLLAGHYIYESLRPSQQWAGRFLLLPPDREPRLRQPDPASIFYPLVQGTGSLNFIDENMVFTTRPRLLFFNKNGQDSEDVTLLLDGKPYFHTVLHGSSGQMHLPAVSMGSHRLTVNTSGRPELYINHLQQDEDGYQLRFANRLTRKGLQFHYLRKSQEAEHFSFSFFSPATGERSKIRVQLSGGTTPAAGEPRQDFTLLDRLYDIHAVEMESVKVLNSGNRHVGEGGKFFFPVGSDMLPGNYTLSVKLENDSEGYLILSKITPGIFSTRKLIKEQYQQEEGNASGK
ncbi:MAG TPA: hypothetical protein EYG88_01755 [Desulfocapsa sulfexigens]|nr:hypothetical protein [Desulfocapsa sulfexigens]